MIIGQNGELWFDGRRIFQPIPRRFEIPGEAFLLPHREAPLMERIQRARDRIIDVVDREAERFDPGNGREDLFTLMRIQFRLIRVLPGAVLREAYQVVREGRETRIAAAVCMATGVVFAVLLW